MPSREKSALKPLNMCFSDFVCEQSRKSSDPVVFTRDFLQYLYIFSPIKCMFYGNYVLCVLLGKAEARGNGCGQTIVLERRGEKSKKTEGEKRQNGKVKALSEFESFTYVHTHTYVHAHMHKHTLGLFQLRCCV